MSANALLDLLAPLLPLVVPIAQLALPAIFVAIGIAEVIAAHERSGFGEALAGRVSLVRSRSAVRRAGFWRRQYDAGPQRLSRW